METNQLFKELRTDPKKLSGIIERDMHKARQESFLGNKNNSFQVKNGSMYMSSIHSPREQIE